MSPTSYQTAPLDRWVWAVSPPLAQGGRDSVWARLRAIVRTRSAEAANEEGANPLTQNNIRQPEALWVTDLWLRGSAPDGGKPAG